MVWVHPKVQDFLWKFGELFPASFFDAHKILYAFCEHRHLTHTKCSQFFVSVSSHPAGSSHCRFPLHSHSTRQPSSILHPTLSRCIYHQHAPTSLRAHSLCWSIAKRQSQTYQPRTLTNKTGQQHHSPHLLLHHANLPTVLLQQKCSIQCLHWSMMGNSPNHLTDTNHGPPSSIGRLHPLLIRQLLLPLQLLSIKGYCSNVRHTAMYKCSNLGT
jgi:hypothetical protein